jgi:hypothetical protein
MELVAARRRPCRRAFPENLQSSRNQTIFLKLKTIGRIKLLGVCASVREILRVQKPGKNHGGFHDFSAP